jgi:hypothetical protein
MASRPLNKSTAYEDLLIYSSAVRKLYGNQSGTDIAQVTGNIG